MDPRSGEIIESHICWYHNVMNLVRKWYITQCGPLDKRAQTMQLPDKLMGELIRFVSSHEVGHTLGLRHNMIASSATPVEKLRDKKWVEANGHTVSIMDYARFNYASGPSNGATSIVRNSRIRGKKPSSCARKSARRSAATIVWPTAVTRDAVRIRAARPRVSATTT